jgi:D-serine deaminase-like pyridoxal phosphate-dependent protein
MKLDGLDTPSVLVDVDIMTANLDRLAGYCREHRLNLRPHVKTHKIPELAQLQVKKGAVGVTVAKLGEAEVMVDGGVEDVLLAYPVYGEIKWKRLVALARRARISVALDSLAVAQGISRHAQEGGVRIPILVEFDTGMRRCGLTIGREAIGTLERIIELPALDYQGLLIYPGHFLVSWERRNQLLTLENQQLSHLLGLLDDAGIPYPVISASSTPTAYMSHQFENINEVRPGTYIFNDRNTVGCQAAVLEDCAVSVLTTVVSTSIPGKAAIDGGSKTFSNDKFLSGDGVGFGHVMGDPGAVVEYLSEEHGHLVLANASRKYRVGHRVRIIPNHVCACVNMHDRIYGIRKDEVVIEWRVSARGAVQ